MNSAQLTAQIGITAILSVIGWLCILGAMRPFSLLVIHRSDVVKAIGYGLLGFSLLALAFVIGMIGAG